ncbi:hypothetical protein CAPTEDRAFT_184892 [Capitella teleta]|uniref:Uncharacterized protein n=1 Tax=Capitella teleta TaxID=283909 RepID=X1ZH76_CAPTE|nr:hypothetical protein CAPTEDRAFT_184892 [Capitella teleta]|eukprot:ELT90107.1 hypothetical protein CAPTEDRAFT_184892 [Capitella teleta]
MGGLCCICELVRVKNQAERVNAERRRLQREHIGLPEEVGCITQIVRDVFKVKKLCSAERWNRFKATKKWTKIRSSIGLSFAFAWYMLNAESPAHAAGMIAMVLALVLSIALAFSPSARNIFMLSIPSIFAKQLRTVLFAYIIMLTMTYPWVNYSKNMHVMTESMTCAQEKASDSGMALTNAAMGPDDEEMEALNTTSTAVKEQADAIKNTFMKVYRQLEEVYDVYQEMTGWMGNLLSICEEESKGPYLRCRSAMQRGFDKCKRVMTIFSGLCYIVKAVQLICVILRIMGKGMGKLIDWFEVDVELQYTFNVTSTQSKDWDDVKEEIGINVDSAMFWMNLVDKICYYSYIWLAVILVFMAYKVILQKSKHTVNEYVMSVASVRMCQSERNKLLTGLMLWFTVSSMTSFMLFMDYGLFWILDISRMYSEIGAQNEMESPQQEMGVNVQGEGPLAILFRTLLSGFPPGKEGKPADFNHEDCIPNPSPPSFEHYTIIWMWQGICLLLVVLEAYALRLRHIIAGAVHTKRPIRRAAWLYNHIMLRRSIVLRRLQGLVKSKYDKRNRKSTFSFIQQLGARYKIIGLILRLLGKTNVVCIVCAFSGKRDDASKMVVCGTTECGAIYCRECFKDLRNKCMLCSDTIEFKPDSDASQEEDSSQEEEDDVEVDEVDAVDAKTFLTQRKKRRQTRRKPFRTNTFSWGMRNMHVSPIHSCSGFYIKRLEVILLLTITCSMRYWYAPSIACLGPGRDLVLGRFRSGILEKKVGAKETEEKERERMRERDRAEGGSLLSCSSHTP